MWNFAAKGATVGVMNSLDELVDAVARGRLALAEISALSEPELDALFALGAEFMDVGRHEDAVLLLQGLITLFPFAARYWRGLGIALHRCHRFADAAAAYDAALLLEPGHCTTRCYRAEALLLLGRICEANDSMAALGEPHGPLASRVAQLRQISTRLEAAISADPEKVAKIEHQSTRTDLHYEFTLTDARPLPFDNSRFAHRPLPQHDAQASQGTQTTTQSMITAWRYAPTAAQLPKDNSLVPSAAAADITKTAIVPRQSRQGEQEPTQTDVAEHLSGGHTNHEHTQTALVRRRLGALSVDDLTDP